ncbi:MAG: hypothetical protein AB7U85_04760 [Alphaproteobacteria bacterium]
MTGIATEIRKIASRLAQGVAERNITESQLRKASEDLNQLSLDVDSLEDVVILKRDYDVPDNVIKIAFALNKKGVTAGMPDGNKPDGGDAA